MKLSELNDVDLVKRFHAGDEVAFAEFVRRHQDQIYRLAHLWLYDVSFVEDVTQEVMLRSYQGLGRFRFRSAPSTWLVRVARNVCLEMNRKSSAYVVLAVAQEPIAQTLPTLEERQHQRQQGITVRNKLSHLTQRQREVVSLRIFEELSVKDTAHIMRCRPGTVKALLHKAIANLKVVMADE